MKCIEPGAIGDVDLIAYMDGEASAEVQAHVDACEGCREEVRRLREAERLVRAAVVKNLLNFCVFL